MTPVRVAYVAFEPFPNAKGSGTRITQMLRALVEQGHAVELLTLPGEREAELPAGAHHRPLPVFHANFLARALAFRDRVARELHAVRPDVIHFRGIFEGQAAMAYAGRYGGRTIFEVNGLPSVELPYHYPGVGRSQDLLGRLRKTEQRLLAAVDVVMTQSQTTLAYLRGRDLPPTTPSFVIPNGADPSAFQGVAPCTPPTVLYAGTLTPWQGVSELLMAARRCAQHRAVRFVLAGPLRRRFRRHLDRVITRLKVAGTVELTGALDREALARRVEAADVCVAPLRRDVRNKAQGCSPIKLFEYMAAARPVVVTDLPCTREIVQPDRGVLLHVPRPKALAEAIEAARGEGPVVVAWSFYSTDFLRAREAMAWIRAHARSEGVLHVAGGVHATAEPEQTLRAGFDLVVLGEGEATFVELFVALAEGRDPCGLPGTAHLIGDRLVSRGPGPRRPLDDFPSFNMRFRHWNGLEITRGCVYACSFCQTPFMFKARFRHRSLDNVRMHVEHLAEHGSRFLRFITPTSLSYGATGRQVELSAVEQLLATCREIMGPGPKIYFGTFPSEIRPEHVTAEALAMLRRYVDNDSILIGGQSGSATVLRASRRGHGVEEIEQAVRLAVEAGFVPHVDFLFGLPGETLEDRQASLALARRLVEQGARIHNHGFMPLPGTPLRDAQPEAIEPQIERGLSALEGRRSLYGKWRGQQQHAQRLVQLRRSGRAAPGSDQSAPS